MYVFGYGSLMNPKSLQKTLPGKSIAQSASIIGYRRIFNMPVSGYLYLNIKPKANAKVDGVLINISDEELAKLKKREKGYSCIDITNAILEDMQEPAYTFIAPDQKYPDMKILQSYINTCLSGVAKNQRTNWLKETIIENPIENDIDNPKYANNC